MSALITKIKMTDHSVVPACLLGSRLINTGAPSVTNTGVSSVALGGNERPIEAPAAAALVEARAFAFAYAVNGAGEGRQKTTQRQTMWAFRGLEPWRDPA